MQEIGGYFELELNDGISYHNNAYELCSGRAALQVILENKKVEKVFIPEYICDVIYQPLKRLKIDYVNYSLDQDFYPIVNFDEIGVNDAFLYVNYFSLFSHVSKFLSATIPGKLIIDNSQAFFEKPIKGVDTFYSARKFFGVPDGGYLYSDIVINNQLEIISARNRCGHLLGRTEELAKNNLHKFRNNEAVFNKRTPMLMSVITKKLLSNVDYSIVAKKRLENFNQLHDSLISTNRFPILSNLNTAPYMYPYLSNQMGLKEFLIKNNIYIPTFWPNLDTSITDNLFVLDLYENLVPIPIDQRYSSSEMNRILNLINVHGKRE